MNRADQLEAIRCSGIPLVQRAVLRAIDDIAGVRAVCWPSLEYVAECAGCSRSTAASAIRWLSGWRPDGTTGPEYITVEKRGRANVYTIHHATIYPNDQSGSRTVQGAGPVREPDYNSPGDGLVSGCEQSGRRTSPVREPDFTSPGAGLHQSGSRTLSAQEAPKKRPMKREEETAPLARVLYGLTPDWLSVIAPVWQQWREHNDERGTPLGARQEAAQVTRLKRSLHTHGAEAVARAITTTIEKGWTGIVWPDEANNGRTTAEDRRAAKAATEYPEDIQIRIIHPVRSVGDG